MRLPVLQYGDPRLLQVAKTVESFDDKLLATVQDMVETLHAENALGLAGQHLGIDQKIIIVNVLQNEGEKFFYRYDNDRPSLNSMMPLVLINPALEVIQGELDLFEEGSISFPGIRGEIERPTDVQVTFQDVKGAKHTLSCDGLLARCIQHEVDHMENVLYLDRMSPRVYSKLVAKLKRLKRKTKLALKKSVAA